MKNTASDLEGELEKSRAAEEKEDDAEKRKVEESVGTKIHNCCGTKFSTLKIQKQYKFVHTNFDRIANLDNELVRAVILTGNPRPPRAPY